MAGVRCMSAEYGNLVDIGNRVSPLELLAFGLQHIVRIAAKISSLLIASSRRRGSHKHSHATLVIKPTNNNIELSSTTAYLNNQS